MQLGSLAYPMSDIIKDRQSTVVSVEMLIPTCRKKIFKQKLKITHLNGTLRWKITISQQIQWQNAER